MNCVNEPIAIIGSACRFAGGVGAPSKLWSLLREPVDLCREIPRDRFNADGFYFPDGAYHGHSNVRHAYFLEEDPAVFDAEFFGIKPVEAKAIDPQQRFLMEVVYETLESAGIPLRALRGSDTSVFAGIMFHDYGAMLVRDHQEIPTYYATGTGQSVVSNRVSYFFDWHGPSITVDTACSSSLVAVHLATQSLRSGESRMALVCGTNMILGPEGFIIESKLQMLSPNGRSRMWDHKADGYARGEGVAAVALKTLSAALEDGDHIQCIIRETGSNQDGATLGITMPSAAAQEDLIRNTYKRAGLDLLKSNDRPQFFEAHGTGTPAGDPIEAEAVYNAFYTSSGRVLPDPLELGSGHPLYVGSIKTVIGHTEGTAGIASLVKASLALQHGTLPPNLLFDQLSDRVAPFYDNLEILREAKPWPVIEGQPRRASVNSFGFGGTNAHAILESYDKRNSEYSDLRNVTPFVFSASSEIALRESLSAFASFLETSRENSSLPSLQDLAWTLYSRRSVFSHRISFTGSSLADVQAAIQTKLKENEDPTVGISTFTPTSSSTSTRQRILGIFTGQGAQYPRMGAELIEKSPWLRKIIQELESHLAEIPETKDRPVWSLEAELLASAESSRVYEAELSQPLCTAVQICLVQLMEIAGVRYSAVVGHSSGEIAAAYAAGYLSAQHASKHTLSLYVAKLHHKLFIKHHSLLKNENSITYHSAVWIAYYRGLYASLSSSPNSPNISGAMMAVGASADDIAELLADSLFAGRVCLAANNSSSSVTVSGDEDAIAELEVVLDDEDIFHTRLKVDKAYHSNHMLPCLEVYQQSIRKLGIEPLNISGQSCTWFSSLRDGQPVDADIAQSMRDIYWPENMRDPVLFFEALSSSLNDSYDLVLEVGPHPALATPAMQTIKQAHGSEIPYHGVLSRGSNAIDALSDTLGFLWSHSENTAIDLDRFERTLNGLGNEHRFNVVQNLPTYQWSHQTKYWHESRSSRKVRNRPHSVHPLLGDTAPDSAPHHMIWRNLLRVSEMEWLAGHVVQNQVVFPAAGYLSTALEAAQWIAANDNARLIEMFDFTIHQALVFERDDTSIEVLIEMGNISHCQQQAQNTIRAQFNYNAALNAQSDDLALIASGNVVIHLGAACPSLLPARGLMVPHMIDVEPERFYSALDDLGYHFQGRFRGLTGLQRKRGRSSCLLRMQAIDDPEHTPLLIHPAEFDAAIQSTVLAYSYPYDEELRTMHLPTTFRQIRVNPAALLSGKSSRGDRDELVPIDTLIKRGVDCERGPCLGSKTGDGIISDVSLYATSDTSHPHAAIQLHGACFKPLGGAIAEEDRCMYTNVHWIPYQPRGIEASEMLWDEQLDHSTAELLERISTFYLRKFYYSVPSDHPAWQSSPTKWYLNYASHMMGVLEDKPPGKKRWEHETLESILAASKPYMHLPDVQIMHLVGTQMPRVFEGQTTMLEEFRADGSDILDRYYSEGLGIHALARWVGRAAKQLTDRNPHLNMLEVGAGTGGATKAIFDKVGNSFLSYTYTDISAGFFENASEVFSQNKDKMIFKTLDLEKDPVEQGFLKGVYDVIISFFVVHATELEPSLRHLRQLLKPGGLLILGEGCETGNGVTPTGFIFGTLPGWWVGSGKGRDLSPLLSPKEWDVHLRAAGFSGADTAPHITLGDIFHVFPIVTQAVDDYVDFLRGPLSSMALNNAGVPPIQKLVLVGGESTRSSHLIERLEIILHDFAIEMYSIGRLEDYHAELLGSTIVSLSDLDAPIFKDITPERFYAYKDIFQSGNTILWVTCGRLHNEPFSNMSEAFARVAMHETPDLSVEHLDIVDPENICAETIAEALLRAHAKAFKSSSTDISWIFEPEIAINQSGSQLVPRTRFIEDLNSRYTAGRRRVERKICDHTYPTAATLQLDQENRYILTESSPYATGLSRNSPSNLIELHIKQVVLSAVKTPFGHKFLVLGTHAPDGVRYLTLASSLTSPLAVSPDCAIRFEANSPPDEVKLTIIASHLICLTALETLCNGQAVVVHNAPLILAEALTIQAAASDIHVTFVADDTLDVPVSWVKIPRYLGSDSDEIFIPQASTAAFIGLSNHQIGQSENETALISLLQSQCQSIWTSKSLFSDVASEISNPYVLRCLGARLHEAVTYASQQWKMSIHKKGSTPIQSVRLEEVAWGRRPADPLCIVDWTDTTSLPVYASRLDASQFFKGSGSTYWIEGMSGALSISLMDWMIRKGARNLVVTSRQPEIAPEWIASHKKRGATVTVLACDVTNEEELQATYHNICDTLPPIAGVVHGAMVLRDVSLQSMSFEQLTDVLRPKVNGSIYLDGIFREIDLDFFVLTSSLNLVVGSKGQANYAAANAFMCSLARQRRNRGFRASVVNGGAIIGAGYMERETRRAWDRVAAQHYMMRLSEEDFVQSICEAIHASRLDAGPGAEISVGLNDVPFTATNRPLWSFEPKHSILVRHHQAVAENQSQGEKTASQANYLQKLQTCTSQEEAYDVVKKAFANMLRGVLQVTSSDDSLMTAKGNEIGLDSLISVDVRSWFLKSLQVGIPILKIMSNTSMESLVQLAVESLPQTLAPQLYASTSMERNDSFHHHTATSPSEVEPGEVTETPITEDSLHLAQEMSKNSLFMVAIDWEAECCPPDDLTHLPLASEMPTPATPANIIVLTGATGLFGRNLLTYLLQDTTVQKVICIAVRDLPRRLANGELPPPSPRVMYYEGELSAPLLGLDPVEAGSIFNSADAVIHNGADTSHLKRYFDVRPCNVGSTATLARLCLPRRVPLHYVSSAGLALFYGRDAFPPISVRDARVLPAADGSLGYASSKWVSEQLLERIHARCGGTWPVCIHRPSTIIREGADALHSKAGLDWMHAMLYHAQQSKSVPHIRMNRGALDLVYVRNACADLVTPLLQGGTAAMQKSPAEVGYVHQVGDIVVSLDRLQDLGRLCDPDAQPFDVLAMDVWIARAINRGLHPAVAALIEIFNEPDAPDYPRLLKKVSIKELD